MNFLEITSVTKIFMKNQALQRKEEAQRSYDKYLLINLTVSFLGYAFIIYVARIIPDNFNTFSMLDLLMFVCAVILLGTSLYYLGTLLHDYIHASEYYSKKANYLMKYILPIVFPLNPSAYRWSHFSHHSNTNRFGEELDTLPPFIKKKTLPMFWLNVIIHSIMLSLLLIIRLVIKPFFMLLEKTRLIYFNYISPIGLVSPKKYPMRKNSQEFRNIIIGDSITVASLVTFWTLSGFNLMFVLMYLVTLFVVASLIAFRTLVDHALVDVQGQQGAVTANFYFTSNFSDKYFWYAGFATYHMIHHINPSIPSYFCREVNDILCKNFSEYQKLHERRNNLSLVIKDFFSKDVKEADLMNI